MTDKRNRMEPIPDDPENHITEQQVNGLLILKKFGWKLVCVRRTPDQPSVTIVKNKQENSVGVLEPDGILKINGSLKIRNQRESSATLNKKTQRLIDKMNNLSGIEHIFALPR